MGALKDAYMKLEKHHNSRPDKYRRIVHAKNMEIADLHGKNDRLLEEITVLKDDKQRLKEQLKKNEEKFTEERTKNIILEGEIIKNKEMSIERDIVNENMRKLKVKYENLKRALKDIEKENTPPREEAPIATITTTVPKVCFFTTYLIDISETNNYYVFTKLCMTYLKLKLPLPNESSVTPATSEAGTPRSTASNSSVYVVPIPVFDIDENEVNSELPVSKLVNFFNYCLGILTASRITIEPNNSKVPKVESVDSSDFIFKLARTTSSTRSSTRKLTATLPSSQTLLTPSHRKKLDNSTNFLELLHIDKFVCSKLLHIPSLKDTFFTTGE